MIHSVNELITRYNMGYLTMIYLAYLKRSIRVYTGRQKHMYLAENGFDVTLISGKLEDTLHRAEQLVEEFVFPRKL